MQFPPCPNFLINSFDWEANGYFTEPQMPNISMYDKKNPWIILYEILEMAKKGDFSRIHELGEFLTPDCDFSYGACCLWLIGDAGKKENLHLLIKTMGIEFPDYLRVKACDAARHSGYLFLCDYILETWLTISLRERGIIGLYLSSLLEEKPGFIFDSFLFDNEEDYIKNIIERIDFFKKQSENEDYIIFMGSEFSVKKLAEYMHRKLVSGEEEEELGLDFIFLRHRFEASTGINCTKFYKKERFNQLYALSVIEEFLDKNKLLSFQKMIRHFFANPLQ